jgi:hypothetical protein
MNKSDQKQWYQSQLLALQDALRAKGLDLLVGGTSMLLTS